MQKCCNNNYVGWFCPRCGSSVSFIDHGGSEPVSVGHLASKNVTINQQLIQGDYIAEGGAKIGTNYENAISVSPNIEPSSLALETNVTNALPPPPADFEDGGNLPPPPADFEDEGNLPPPPADFEDGGNLPPPPADFEDEGALPPPPSDNDNDGIPDMIEIDDVVFSDIVEEPSDNDNDGIPDMIEIDDVVFSDIVEEPSEGDFPPISAKATTYDQGFEWIEHPINSGIWFFRDNDNDEWELMK